MHTLHSLHAHTSIDVEQAGSPAIVRGPSSCDEVHLNEEACKKLGYSASLGYTVGGNNVSHGRLGAEMKRILGQPVKKCVCVCMSVLKSLST